MTSYQVHGERALLAVLRIASLSLLHEDLALAHGVTHDGHRSRSLSTPVSEATASSSGRVSACNPQTQTPTLNGFLHH